MHLKTELTSTSLGTTVLRLKECARARERESERASDFVRKYPHTRVSLGLCRVFILRHRGQAPYVNSLRRASVTLFISPTVALVDSSSSLCFTAASAAAPQQSPLPASRERLRCGAGCPQSEAA